MPNNNNFIPKENLAKVETIQQIETTLPTYEEFVKKSNLSLTARKKIINKSGSNYQSPLIDKDISEVKGYGPCSVCYKDTQWTSLYMGCPTSYCGNTSTSYWCHSNSGYLNASDQSGCGRLEISNNGSIKCQGCGTASDIKNWKFSCSSHRGNYGSVDRNSFTRTLMVAGDFSEIVADLAIYLRSHN
jgi:hypothetical protein